MGLINCLTVFATMKSTVIYRECCAGNVNKVRDLPTREPAAITKQSKEGSTLLHIAITTGNVELCSCLLSSATERDIMIKEVHFIDVYSKEHKYAINQAAGLRNFDIVKLLLQHGATVSGDLLRDIVLDSNSSSSTAILELLLLQNITPSLLNSRSNAGETALHVAVRNRSHKNAKLLINAGVDVNIKDNTSRKNAFEIAVDNSDIKMMKLIGNCGRFDFRPISCSRSLQEAVQNNNAGEVIAYLLSKNVMIVGDGWKLFKHGCYSTLVEHGFHLNQRFRVKSPYDVELFADYDFNLQLYEFDLVYLQLFCVITGKGLISFKSLIASILNQPVTAAM